MTEDLISEQKTYNPREKDARNALYDYLNQNTPTSILVLPRFMQDGEEYAVAYCKSQQKNIFYAAVVIDYDKEYTDDDLDIMVASFKKTIIDEVKTRQLELRENIT